MTLPALTAVDAGAFNRVVGLGVGAPATQALVDEVVGFYRSAGQCHFRVELAPVARPDDVTGWLRAAGLHPVEEQVTKVWGHLDDLAADDDTGDDADIRELRKEDAERVAALNVRSWGAWHSYVPLGPWFGATVGRAGFVHYGAFVEDRLLCTGALVDARGAGCTLIHAEARTDRLSGRARMLDTLYVRTLYAPGDPAPGS